MKKLLIALMAITALFLFSFTACIDMGEETSTSEQQSEQTSTETSESDTETSSVEETVYYTVTFVNLDGTELQSGSVESGEIAAYTGETPTMDDDVQWSYGEFTGWDHELAAVTSDTVYTATFNNKTLRKYNVTFEAASAMETIRVDYGTSVSALAAVAAPVPEGFRFVKWQLKTGEDTYVDFAGNETLTEDITVKAVYARNEVALPEGAVLINDYSSSFTSWVQNWGGCAGNSVYYEETLNTAGVLAIENSNTYIACTISSMSALSESVKNAVAEHPAYYGIVLRLYATEYVTAIQLGFGGGNGNRLGSLEAITANTWTTLTFPLSADEGISTNDLFVIMTTSSGDPVAYFDQIYLVELPTYSLTVNGGSAAKETYHVNEPVTLTVDETAIPEGKSFGCWNVNGVNISGNTFNMPGQATAVNAVYVVNELAIPQGAKLVSDYSTSATPWNNPNYGSGTVGVVNYYPEYDGRAGVQAFGSSVVEERAYINWTAIAPSFDATGYNKITLRVKIDTSKCVRAVLENNDGLSLITPATSNQWGEVTFNVSDLGAFYLYIAADHAGECVWIDQIYLKVASDIYDVTQFTSVWNGQLGDCTDWFTLGATSDGNQNVYSWGAVGTTYVGLKFNLKLGANPNWLFISFGAPNNKNAHINGSNGVMLCISAESHKGCLINRSAGFGGIDTGYDFSEGGEYLIEVGVLEAGHYYFKVNGTLVQEFTDMEACAGSYLNITSWDGNTQVKTAA